MHLLCQCRGAVDVQECTKLGWTARSPENLKISTCNGRFRRRRKQRGKRIFVPDTQSGDTKQTSSVALIECFGAVWTLDLVGFESEYSMLHQCKVDTPHWTVDNRRRELPKDQSIQTGYFCFREKVAAQVGGTWPASSVLCELPWDPSVPFSPLSCSVAEGANHGSCSLVSLGRWGCIRTAIK